MDITLVEQGKILAYCSNNEAGLWPDLWNRPDLHDDAGLKQGDVVFVG